MLARNDGRGGERGELCEMSTRAARGQKPNRPHRRTGAEADNYAAEHITSVR